MFKDRQEINRIMKKNFLPILFLLVTICFFTGLIIIAQDHSLDDDKSRMTCSYNYLRDNEEFAVIKKQVWTSESTIKCVYRINKEIVDPVCHERQSSPLIFITEQEGVVYFYDFVNQKDKIEKDKFICFYNNYPDSEYRFYTSTPYPPPN